MRVRLFRFCVVGDILWLLAVISPYFFDGTRLRLFGFAHNFEYNILCCRLCGLPFVFCSVVRVRLVSWWMGVRGILRLGVFYDGVVFVVY